SGSCRPTRSELSSLFGWSGITVSSPSPGTGLHPHANSPTEYLEWYSDHLITLRNDGRVDARLFVTRRSLSQPASPLPASPMTEMGIKEISELAISNAAKLEKKTPQVQSQSSINSLRSEKSQRSEAGDPPVAISGVPIRYERPDVSALIRRAVD